MEDPYSNYSNLNYIKEPQVQNRYEFIPPLKISQKKHFSKKSTYIIGLLVVVGVSVLAFSGNFALSGYFNKETFNRAELENKGSDDVALVAESIPEKKAHYDVSSSAQNLKLNADAYLIADLSSGEIIVSKNPEGVYPIASVSKLMTALVAQESLDLRAKIEVTRTALNTYGTAGELKLGEKAVAVDLIYPLLIESSNDVAHLFAEQLPNGEFISLMNQKAKVLGMKDTHYVDASGLTPYNVSTPNDLFSLARYIYENKPDIFDITRVKQFAVLKHDWVNHNHFLGYENFIGGKNGYTDEARRTTVSLFSWPVSEDETRVIAVILLKTEDREKDMSATIAFLKKNLKYEE